MTENIVINQLGSLLLYFSVTKVTIIVVHLLPFDEDFCILECYIWHIIYSCNGIVGHVSTFWVLIILLLLFTV